MDRRQINSVHYRLRRRSSIESEGKKSESSFADENSSDEEDEVEEINDEPEKDVVPERESCSVQATRICVLILMLTMAAVICGGTYVFLKNEQHNDFLAATYFFTESIANAVKSHAKNLFGAFQDLSLMITSDAERFEATFPNNTIRNFEVMGEWARGQSGVEIFGYAPLVEQNLLEEWESYSAENQGWLEESREISILSGEATVQTEYKEGNISRVVYDFGGPDGSPRRVQSPGPYFPLWHISPPPFDPLTVNMDFGSFPFAQQALQVMRTNRRGHLTPILDQGLIESLAAIGIDRAGHLQYHQDLVDWEGDINDRHLLFFEPVYNETRKNNSEIAGFLAAFLSWDRYVANLLPHGVAGLVVVIESNCHQPITYRINGHRAQFLGYGDLHEAEKYEVPSVVVPFTYGNMTRRGLLTGECVYSFEVYPGTEFEDSYKNNMPMTIAIIVACAFSVLILAFLVFDGFVGLRTTEVVRVASAANDIVTSLFPSKVRNRLYQERREEDEKRKPKAQARMALLQRSKDMNDSTRLEQFLSGDLEEMIDASEDGEASGFMYKTKPIADKYESTTILFADIAGFTAWSASREPEQVFTLLETIYKGFDDIAKRKKVFKVETIGDCYVAVAGLPRPMKEHATTMCRFARASMDKMRSLLAKLEPTLGKETLTLDMRFGLHSGPVTAGVLRGERGRFQLFGDTMNTASRMESNGVRGKIHISQATADLLRATGKGHWLVEREDRIVAKGKGEMVTYWVEIARQDLGASTHSMNSDPYGSATSDKLGTIKEEPAVVTMGRMDPNQLEVHVDAALGMIEEIVGSDNDPSQSFFEGTTDDDEIACLAGDVFDTFRLDDALPFEPISVRRESRRAALSGLVRKELQHYIRGVAAMHRKHPFHNFDHSSAVASRLLAFFSAVRGKDESPSSMIIRDPVIRLASLFACICHGIDHPGVPNAVALEENPSMTELNQYGCINEQNAFDVGWEMLQEDTYENLRAAIFVGSTGRERFRQTFYHCVISTNMWNTSLTERRNKLWEEAFDNSTEECSRLTVGDLRATVLLECLVQVSVMGHAGEPWKIYRKCNTKLFEELYTAHICGRLEDDPADTWYEQELEFFENSAIVITRRLTSKCSFDPVLIGPFMKMVELNRLQWKNTGPGVISEIMNDIVSS